MIVADDSFHDLRLMLAHRSMKSEWILGTTVCTTASVLLVDGCEADKCEPEMAWAHMR
jgi:hypothetical protein